MPVSRVYDPSKLHLRKELTQIKKSARALRDPGTCSSLKSPLSSTRSVLAGKGATKKKIQPLPATGKEGERRKEKRAILCNWRSNSNNKSSSGKSLSRAISDDNDADGSSSVSACLSDARNGCGGGGDSKSDSYVDEMRNGQRRRVDFDHVNKTMGFRCEGARLSSVGPPAMAKRAVGKVKLRKSGNGCLIKRQGRKRLKHVVLDRKLVDSKPGLKGMTRCCSSQGLSQDDSMSLIDQSDGTEEWYNSEDLCNSSAVSPFLARLMQKNFPRSSKKLLKGSSYTCSTPAMSTRSFNRCFNYINPISSGSWDGTTVSLNNVDDEAGDPLDLPGQQGCGIPCYWSRRSTPKYRGGHGCSPPSLSDTLLRKGSVRLCGSQKSHHRGHTSSSQIGKYRIATGAAEGRHPLLSSYDGGALSYGGNSEDELSLNFGEVDLEGMSRLDGKRWSSSCRSQEGLDQHMALAGDSQDEYMLENGRSLSQKYRPMFFNELVGQKIAVQSLMNAITRERIAPVYLFHGPRGTGKTCTAKIFAAALNCLATGGTKPCGICRKCSNFLSCRNRDVMEVDGTNKKGIDNVKYLLKKLAVAPPSAMSSYKVFIIDECHLLPAKTWAVLLKFLEDPIPLVVFIFITTDLENVPHAILSRCQKHLFNKIKDVEIVSRLQRVAVQENLDVELDALELITLNSDGSLRDAETMLEQLSLLGKRITASLVNELVGIIPDDKLLELLELAMSSNTSETVKRARDLLDSGADPLVLMSQIASLIMDIIAGNYLTDGAKCNNSFYGGRSLTEFELEKLRHALQLLSEAEKQLRLSSERSTWFTATLLQLGSFTSPEFTLSGSSRRQSSKTTEEDQSTASRHGPGNKSTHSADTTSSPDDLANGEFLLSKSDMEKLDHLWLQCIIRCQHEKLSQLLQTHGKLISLSEVDGVLLAYIAFGDENTKARAELYLISITNLLEMVLRRSIEVRIIVLPGALLPTASREALKSQQSSSVRNQMVSRNNSPFSTPLPLAASCGNDQVGGKRRQVIPMQRIESIIREQKLETAWLQAVDRPRPERNQVLPQDSAVYGRNRLQSMSSMDFKALKVNDKKAVEKDHKNAKAEQHPISPSLLHQNSLSKDYQGYESGTGGKGCNILFCCYNRHHRKEKVNKGAKVQLHI